MSSNFDWTCDVCKKTFDSFRGLISHRQINGCFITKNRNVCRQKKTRPIIEGLEEEYSIGLVNSSLNNSKFQELSSVLQNNNSSGFSNNSSSSPFGLNDFDVSLADNLDYECSPGPNFEEEINDDLVESAQVTSISAKNNNFINNKYMDFQRKFMSLTTNNTKDNTNQTTNYNNHSGLSSHLNLGRVSSITSSTIGHSGTHRVSTGLANPRDVLNIFIFIKTHWMSEGTGDGLLELIKQLFRNHPPIDDFFLHRNMKSINKALNRSMESLYTANEIHTTLPYKLRGSSISERVTINNILNKRDRNPQLIIASGIGMDLMEVLSEILVSHDFDYSDFLPILDVNDGIRSYSNLRLLNYFIKHMKKYNKHVVQMFILFVFN